jgi:hypothetical protein
MGRVALAFFVACMGWPALGAECQLRTSGAHFVEWQIGDDLRGVRLRPRGTQWSLSGLGYHLSSVASCETCASGQVSTAYVWLGAADGRVDVSALDPENIAGLMTGFPLRMRGEVGARSEALSFRWAGLEGFKRIFQLKPAHGQVQDVIALVAARADCFSLSAILASRSGTIPPDARFDSLAEGIEFENYRPDLPPGEAPDPFGDFRRNWHGDARQ